MEYRKFDCEECGHNFVWLGKRQLPKFCTPCGVKRVREQQRVAAAKRRARAKASKG